MQLTSLKIKHAAYMTLVATSVLLTACGGGNDSAAEAETAAQTETAMEVTPTSTDGTWTTVAWQNERFTVSGTKYVRYGLNDRWVGKWVSDSGTCSTTFFGSNPYEGVGKQCQVFTRTTTTTPTPTPTYSAKLTSTAPAGTVSGYRVYYGTVSRNYEQALGGGKFSSTNSISLSGLPSGAKYYFSVTAVDAAGMESGYSNEVSKTIP